MEGRGREKWVGEKGGGRGLESERWREGERQERYSRNMGAANSEKSRGRQHRHSMTCVLSLLNVLYVLLNQHREHAHACTHMK